MKTLFTFALAGLLASSSLAANSNEDLLANTDAQAKFKKVNVLLHEGIGKTKVAILDENGKILHQRTLKVKDENLLLPYDLSEFPSGEYQVKISADDEEVIYKVETFERKLTPEELPLVAYGKAIDTHTVHITVVGLTQPGVKVTIRRSDSNKIIHAEVVDQAEGFQKDYKLQGLEAEDVYFQLEDQLGRKKTIVL